MGLASALSTALTGLTASETTIDVVGNNLANSNTVGFKSSEATFASQFLQTISLGSSPNEDSGGTNPRQTGLGTMVAQITPNFNQGTIEISSNSLDLAIQGEGFFMVEGSGGDRLYSRNGIFTLNSENQLTTLTGNRVLGYGVDDNYQIQQTEYVPLEISLGGTEVAQATSNVYLEGTLTSEGIVASASEIITSGVLGDSRYTYPVTSGVTAIASAIPDPSGVNSTDCAGSMDEGVYWYKIVFCDAATGDPAAYLDSESVASAAFSAEVEPGDNAIELTSVPVDSDGNYRSRRIYRTNMGAGENGTYYYVDEISNNTVDFYTDRLNDSGLGEALNTDILNSTYEYRITYVNSLGVESRPSEAIEASIADGRIQLLNIPAQTAGDQWTGINIYRTTASNDYTYYRIASITGADTPVNLTDNISDETAMTGQMLDFNGPRVTSTTPLGNVIKYNENNKTYTSMFAEGTLEFIGVKGGRDLAPDVFNVTSTTALGALVQFMEEAMGIVSSSGDSIHPISNDPVTGKLPGGYVDASTGQIYFVSNTGVENAVSVMASALKLSTESEGTVSRDLGFSTSQEAIGSSVVTDVIVYDSLGMKINVRITCVLEEMANETVYRWYADSPDNQTALGNNISVGTGLIYFDGEGNFDRATNDVVSVYREEVPSESPLQIKLQFDALSGLGAGETPTLAVSLQDGSAPGTLTSYIIGEDGLITGVFSNGITRSLGQILLSRFSNPTGLIQEGENLYSAGVNSGLPIVGTPNSQGIGSILSGAVELSNTDIGGNLIDLILASTMYRGNARVITTTQEMMDELLALGR